MFKSADGRSAMRNNASDVVTKVLDSSRSSSFISYAYLLPLDGHLMELVPRKRLAAPSGHVQL